MQSAKRTGVAMLALTTIVVALLTYSLASSQPSGPTTAFGPNWDRTCSGAACTVTIYPFQKYYQEGGQWQEINEDFQPCPSADFCVPGNLYQASLANGSVSLSSGTRTAAFRLLAVRSGGTELTLSYSSAGANANRVEYRSVLPGMDITFSYLSRVLKEEITIHAPLFSTFSDDPVFSYQLANEGFFIEPPWICDAAGECQDLVPTIAGGTYSFSVPLAWLNNASRVYPVIIDPSVSLDNQSVIFQGYVARNPNVNPNTYVRQSAQSIRVGPFLGGFPTSRKIYRGVIEWNVSSIPDESRINAIILTIRANQVANCPANTNISFQDMDLQMASYPDTNAGNNLSFMDMANLSISQPFNWTNITAIQFYNITIRGEKHLEARLPADWFSTGMASQIENDCAAGAATNETRFDSPAADPANRPVLTITYTPLANESEGRRAIEVGINGSSLGSPRIRTDQQLYVLDQNAQHAMGTFDKFTKNATQRWAFNYVTGNESFTNISSLFRTVNIWENQSLTFDEIATQVETFINSTKV
ncbi:MAG: hypothetical protein HY520_05175 [Candidatus Aenigmarchaeota archaeon]|nr:hypothetical protein [Candidatus Aenigmarchaeota archaeon]